MEEKPYAELELENSELKFERNQLLLRLNKKEIEQVKDEEEEIINPNSTKSRLLELINNKETRLEELQNNIINAKQSMNLNYKFMKAQFRLEKTEVESQLLKLRESKKTITKWNTEKVLDVLNRPDKLDDSNLSKLYELLKKEEHNISIMNILKEYLQALKIIVNKDIIHNNDHYLYLGNVSIFINSYTMTKLKNEYMLKMFSNYILHEFKEKIEKLNLPDSFFRTEITFKQQEGFRSQKEGYIIGFDLGTYNYNKIHRDFNLYIEYTK